MAKSKIVILLVISIAISSVFAGRSDEQEFKDFMRLYRKSYRTQAEYERRFQIFKDNLALAYKQVKDNQGSANFGITKFSDLTPAEFADRYLSGHIEKPELLTKTKFNGEGNALGCVPNSENFDWGSCGAVSGIKDQDKCSSSYAFAAVEEIESAYALKTGSLKSLSAQQVIDCNEASTCTGGDVTSALEYVQKSNSLALEKDYPFSSTSGVSGSCKAQIKSEKEVKEPEAECQGSILTCQQMQALAAQYFPAQYQTDMICIAHYESSWCTNIYNGICCYGLWQINQNHLGEQGCPSSVSGLADPDQNAQCAAQILNSQGLDAWQTWTEGDCNGWTGCSSNSSANTSSTSISGNSNSGNSNSGNSNSGNSNSGNSNSGNSNSGNSNSGNSNSGNSNSGHSTTSSSHSTSSSTTHKPSTSSSTTHKPSTSSSSNSGNSNSGNSNSGNSNSGKSTSGKSTSTGSSTGSTGTTSTGATGTTSTGATGQPTGSTGSTGPTGSTGQPTGSTSAQPTGSTSAQPTGSTTGDTTGDTSDTTGDTTGDTSGDTTGDTTSGDTTGSYDFDFDNYYGGKGSNGYDIPQFSIRNFTNFQLLNGEEGIYSQVSSKNGGPVLVAVDATNWQHYAGGVVTSCGENVNHYAQVVGYMSYGKQGAYWIVRNSWGSQWGEEGYVYIAVGEDVCGIGSQPIVVV